MLHQIPIISMMEEPTEEPIAIPAITKLVIVATVMAVPAETPTAVKRVVKIGTSATPPVRTTAAIVNAVTAIIATVATICFQWSRHH